LDIVGIAIFVPSDSHIQTSKNFVSALEALIWKPLIITDVEQWPTSLTVSCGIERDPVPIRVIKDLAINVVELLAVRSLRDESRLIAETSKKSGQRN
jgi:hypothetical protein